MDEGAFPLFRDGDESGTRVQPTRRYTLKAPFLSLPPHGEKLAAFRRRMR